MGKIIVLKFFKFVFQSIIVKGHEKNALNIYKTRMCLIGEDPSNMPHLFNPLATLVLPSQTSNNMYPPPTASLNQSSQHPNIGSVTVDTNSPQNNSQLISPPLQSSSPQDRSQSPTNRYMSVSPVGQKIVGIEMKIKRMSLDASSNGKSLSMLFYYCLYQPQVRNADTIIQLCIDIILTLSVVLG